MKRLLLFAVCVLCLSMTGRSAEPTQPSSLVLKGDIKTVDVPRTVIVVDKVQVIDLTKTTLTITAPAGATDYRWKYPAGVTANDDDSETLEITSAPKGSLTVSVRMKTYSIKDGALVVTSKSGSITFTVGEVVPPKPPDPVDPAPIPVDGFRVLFVVETSDASKLPKEQLAILTSGEVRGYLNSKCVSGPDGVTKEWRQWDQNVKTDGESKLWQDAMKRNRASLPWIVISDGKTGFEGPLPATIQATLALLRKFGGN